LASSAAFTSANRIRQKFSIGLSISSFLSKRIHLSELTFLKSSQQKKCLGWPVEPVEPLWPVKINGNNLIHNAPTG
jgi:hypothetical protein